MAVHSFKAGTTIGAQRIVYISARNTVSLYNTVTSFPVGISLDTVDDTTQGIAIACVGEKAKLFFNDTVSAGGLVTGDSSGRGVPFTLGATSTAISAPAAYVGVLVGNAVSSTGTIAEILVAPGYDRNAR